MFETKLVQIRPKLAVEGNKKTLSEGCLHQAEKVT